MEKFWQINYTSKKGFYECKIIKCPMNWCEDQVRDKIIKNLSDEVIEILECHFSLSNNFNYDFT